MAYHLYRKTQKTEAGATSPELVLEGAERDMPASQGGKKERKSVLDKWADKLKEFLDNAE